MNKFYDWFENKGYKKIFDTTICRECQKKYIQKKWINYQMLIGFLIEYLKEVHNTFVGWPYNSCKKITIKGYYDSLIDEITNLDKKQTRKK